MVTILFHAIEFPVLETRETGPDCSSEKLKTNEMGLADNLFVSTIAPLTRNLRRGSEGARMTPAQVRQERVERVYRAMLKLLSAPSVRVDVASVGEILELVSAAYEDRILQRTCWMLTRGEAEQVGDALREDGWEVLVGERTRIAHSGSDWHTGHWTVAAKHPKAEIDLKAHLGGPNRDEP